MVDSNVLCHFPYLGSGQLHNLCVRFCFSHCWVFDICVTKYKSSGHHLSTILSTIRTGRQIGPLTIVFKSSDASQQQSSLFSHLLFNATNNTSDCHNFFCSVKAQVYRLNLRVWTSPLFLCCSVDASQFSCNKRVELTTVQMHKCSKEFVHYYCKLCPAYS
jgi:hypothetical protein